MTVAPHEAPGAEVAVTDPAPLVIDRHYQELLAYEAYCAEAVRTWKREQEKYRDRIKELLGEATTGVSPEGDELVTYAPKAVMRTKDFAKDHPNLYKLFTHPITKDEFDVEWFQRARPELYAQYQSRALVNKVEPARPSAPPMP